MIREKETKRYMLGFVSAFVLFAIIRNGTYFIEVTHERPYYFYMISQLGCFLLVSCWMLTVQSRIIVAKIRRLMMYVGGMFLLYFTMQMVKYCLFTEDMLVGKYMWYGYYIPMTMIPLLAFYIIRYLASGDDEISEKRWRHLLIPAVMICIGFLTNDIHRLAFYIPNWDEMGDKGKKNGPIYYLYIAFMAVLLILGIISVAKAKNKSIKRKKLLYPLIPIFIGACYFVVYSVKPGWLTMPNGKIVLQIAEVFAFMMIGFLEVCIQIGLIPSNLGYRKLFSLTGIPAYVSDKNGKIIYTTDGAGDGFAPSEDHRIVETAVIGGRFTYDLDLSKINRLNTELDETTTYIESRNELLRHENEIKAEREKTDTAIQIYDNISEIVSPWLTKTQNLLSKDCDESEFRSNLIQIAVMNAYIKRRSNMELEAQKNGGLSFEELITAVTESLEYAKLAGMETYLSASGKGMCQSKMIVDAYLAFETIVEEVLGKVEYMTVRLSLDDELTMRFLLTGSDKLDGLQKLCVEGCEIKCVKEGHDYDVSVSVSKGGEA